jgi:DNA-binding transcriptional ArsR family regulator
MAEDIDEIKKELEEIRRIKADLQEELEEVRRTREDHRRERRGRIARPPTPPRPARPYRAAVVDLAPITEGLEDMMEGLGDQIRESVRGLEDIGDIFSGPILKARKKSKHKKREKKYQRIPPERVARVVSPLGSEERLKILYFLKDGAKSFNELETYTGKTGSSLTHHLNPLLEAGYVIKGEVRGTYYVTVEGSLAYRLAQWLTSKVERQRYKSGNGDNYTLKVDKDETTDDDEFHVAVVKEVDDDTEDIEDTEVLEPLDSLDPVEPVDSIDEEDDW